MQRNLEVMNLNQSLEDQLASLEKELVDTKLQFATVFLFILLHKRSLCTNLNDKTTEEHESLKGKWNDIKKVLEIS